MANRTYDATLKRWAWLQEYRHNGSAWREVIASDEDEAVSFQSIFKEDNYLGRGTILQRDISQMPVHTDSDAMAKFMWDWSPFSPAGGWGSKTALNTSAYGTQPIHGYVVDSTHPDCHFQPVMGTSIQTPQAEIDAYMSGMIPWPSWAVPAQNHDRGIAIYDKGTGFLREYFGIMKRSDGVWADMHDPNKSATGGYSVVRHCLQHLAEDNYALQQRRGISNVAGMHNNFGFIGITEALAKKINHALCFTFGAAWGKVATKQEYVDALAIGMQNSFPARVSWPARAADGKAERYIPEANGSFNSATPHLTPTHGQWGRLKADVDPMHNPRTGRPYNPFTRVVIEAAKTYGLVGTDTNLWVNAFNAEQGRTFQHRYGVDPWASGLIANTYRDEAYSSSSWTNLEDFPWDRTEWAPLDWGRPEIDYNLRPGQRYPSGRESLY